MTLDPGPWPPDEERRRYFGKYPGLVTDPAPETGEHRGVIEIEVPGVLVEDPADPERSEPLRCLARPCFAPGFFSIPAVGQQVWVEFVAGNLEDPIWTGLSYPIQPHTLRPPRDAEGHAPHAEQLVIRLGSMVVVLDQQAGALTLLDEARGHRIHLDDQGITVKSATVVRIDAPSVEVQNQGALLASFAQEVRLLVMGHTHPPPAGICVLDPVSAALFPSPTSSSRRGP